MKRILILVVLLAGCEMPPAAPRPKAPPTVDFKSGPTYWLDVTADPDTGCQYLLYQDRTITPRIAADGKTHMGCKAAKQ